MSDETGKAPIQAAVIPVTPLQQNCTLIWDTTTMEGCVIDPGGDVPQIQAAIKEVGMKVTQIVLTHVRDIRGDFFGAQLGVTGHTGQFLDVDRGVTVFLNDALRNEDGIFEVVAIPRHERDQHVLTQGQFAQIG